MMAFLYSASSFLSDYYWYIRHPSTPPLIHASIHPHCCSNTHQSGRCTELWRGALLLQRADGELCVWCRSLRAPEVAGHFHHEVPEIDTHTCTVSLELHAYTYTQPHTHCPLKLLATLPPRSSRNRHTHVHCITRTP
jgi:hypothetical protein